jgi:hypothetical protein
VIVVLAMLALTNVVRTGSRWALAGASLALAGLALTRVAFGWVVTVRFVVWLVTWLARRTTSRRLAVAHGLALALCVPWLAYSTSRTPTGRSTFGQQSSSCRGRSSSPPRRRRAGALPRTHLTPAGAHRLRAVRNRLARGAPAARGVRAHAHPDHATAALGDRRRARSRVGAPRAFALAGDVCVTVRPTRAYRRRPRSRGNAGTTGRGGRRSTTFR